MNTYPLVSVVIPTYNRADIVCRAIDSVLNQTYTNTEVIVVDDGSTDHTARTLAKYKGRIQLRAQENAGPSIARNRGISWARGEMVAFLDSDDYWLPTKLSRQLEAMEKAGESVPCCLCNCQVLYKDGATTSTFRMADMVPDLPDALWLNPAEVLFNRFVLFTQAAMIRREALERVGCFDERLRFCEDYDLPLRLSLQGPWVVLQDELVVYQTGSKGSWAETAVREEVRLHEDLLRIRQQMSMLVESSPRHVSLRRVARRELRRAQRQLAFTRLTRAESRTASALGRSLRFIERLRRAALRRGPLYPRMLVQQLG
jgi:glycosyltransferase involved in cell wall biosynthesis